MRRFAIIILIFASGISPRLHAQTGIILKGEIPIYTDATSGDPLFKAVTALQNDLEKVLGARATIRPLSAIGTSGIVIANDAKAIGIAPLHGWEAHCVFVKSIKFKPQVVLQGADPRGTIFAVYTFSEKVLGVPPLWYYSGWVPKRMNQLALPAGFAINIKSPAVKYRAWFPNDTDLFDPWRKRSPENYERWLETALRLKLNTIEWFDSGRDYADRYSVSPTTKLINDYGLINTTHHHSPLNASFEGWEDYWKKTRDTIAPELSLANVKCLEDFWRYNAESIVRNKINMLWVIGFRGRGDHPFWYTFKDAPESMKERGEVISRMLAKQRQIVLEVSGDNNAEFRTIFYDELSDLLAQGFIHAPTEKNFTWTYVAARRDHYPNEDMQKLEKGSNQQLGYYFNYQFTSTGSHLAAGEGPWKMEQNYRYVASKSNKPIEFSVVNAGNIREFVLELSANAEMMWNFTTYNTDRFLENYCKQYFGKNNAKAIAQLYKEYYQSYWKQRKADLNWLDRQYIFQDLRYKRALMEIGNAYSKPYNANPLTDIPAEQLKGRTYRLIPEDNGATNQVDAVISGTGNATKRLSEVVKRADALSGKLEKGATPFFNDNLRAPAAYMNYLNLSLFNLATGYKSQDSVVRQQLKIKSLESLENAEKALLTTQHGVFDHWYEGDRVFGFQSVYRVLK